MAKAYWISIYTEVRDPEKLAAYAAIAAPAIIAAGGRFLVRGVPAVTYEAGIKERTTLIEFDGVEAAVAAHDSPGYQEALAVLADGVVREIRICEGA